MLLERIDKLCLVAEKISCALVHVLILEGWEVSCRCNLNCISFLAQLVRGRGGQNFQQDAPLDPSVPSSSEAGLMDKQNFEQGSEEYRNFKSKS